MVSIIPIYLLLFSCTYLYQVRVDWLNSDSICVVFHKLVTSIFVTPSNYRSLWLFRCIAFAMNLGIV
jgi:hypothetical protein